MKKTLLALAAVVLTPLSLLAESHGSKDDELLALRRSVWAAWFENDVKTLERLLPAEALYVSTDTTPFETRAETLAGSRKFRESGGKLLRLEFPKNEIRRFGDLVLIYSTYVFEIDENGKRTTEEGKGVEVFLKKDGRWIHPAWCLARK
jgi:ketosteroid isomerase-like protein